MMLFVFLAGATCGVVAALFAVGLCLSASMGEDDRG